MTIDLTSVLNKGGSKIKKKIRDIRRLLSRDNLPSDVVVANERALKILEGELQNVQSKQQSQRMAGRYQKVRFFEKKKAERHYRHAKRKLEALEAEDGSKEDVAKAQKALKKASVELAYVLNFPTNEKYVALYAQDAEATNENGKKGLEKTRAIREECLERFGKQLDDGTLVIGAKAKNTDRKEEKKPEKKQAAKQEDDFFE